MKAKTWEKEEAIRMRLKGHTLPEICRKLGVSKGGCQVWLKGVHLPPEIRAIIERKKTLAQDKGRAMMKQRRAERDQQINQKAKNDFSTVKLNKNTRKLLCAVLYWAEGHKRTPVVSFTNSDPHMIRTYLALFRSSFTLNEAKFSALLHLHEYHNVKKQKKFWSNVTGIPTGKISIYLKPNTGINIRPGYPGCIAIRYGDVKLAKEIEFLYTCLINKFRGVV